MATSAVRNRELVQAASELRIVLGQLVRRLRSEHSFPISHGAVLSRLDREGPQTASALAVAERVRPQSMAQTLAELENEQLVHRRPDPDDRRRWLVELTGHGREVLSGDRARREGWLARAIASELTPEEQLILLRAVPLLRRLTDS
jgi:DNA-binding MarR family transcriptional regulator